MSTPIVRTELEVIRPGLMRDLPSKRCTAPSVFAVPTECCAIGLGGLGSPAVADAHGNPRNIQATSPTSGWCILWIYADVSVVGMEACMYHIYIYNL